mgnify:CR=1 FL=1
MPVFIKLVFIFLLLLLSYGQANAHEGRPVYIEVNVAAMGKVALRWKIPPVMASGQEPSISLQGNNCQPLKIRTLSDSSMTRPSARLSGHRQYLCLSSNAKPMRIVLMYPNNNPALSSLINLQKQNGESYSLFNGPETLIIKLPEKMSLAAVAKQYVQGGFLHILSGFDHLLFVLCLMQIAFGRRTLILTITGFTLGHSATLALSSLGLVSVRINVVEVLIALSIVMLIVEITKSAFGKRSSSLIWRYPVLVSLGFGLLHGFGFASALSELGLPSAMKLPALAFFNIGVEAGQLAFIATALLVMRLMSFLYSFVFKKVALESSVVKPVQFPIFVLYFMGSLSCYWFVDRSVGLFF